MSEYRFMNQLTEKGQIPTPAYVFDLDEMKEFAEKVKRCLTGKAEICYAMKANPFLIKSMMEIVSSLEVCSPGEFRICERAGIPMEKIVLSGVYKNPDDIAYMLDRYGNSGTYTVESLQHLKVLNDTAVRHGIILSVLIRVTSGNQFGMDEDTVLEILKKAKELPGIEAEGIHYFSGTQKKNLKRHQKELTYLDEFLKKAAEEQIDVKCLEYGSGTAVPYFRDKTAETFEETGLKGLQDAVKAMQWKGHVTVELGRALAAMCGYYLTKVEDTKTSDGIHYCIVDGGCHQINYDGQIKGMYEPYVKVLPKEVSMKDAEDSEDKNTEEKTWKVCGSLCTLNDVLCNEITLRGLEKGSILVFERTGAYSAMEGMALFLSHELPGVVLYSEEEGWIQARVQQETYELNMVEQLS